MERIDPDQHADELTMLGQYLDYHRATLVAKATGVDEAGWRATVTRDPSAGSPRISAVWRAQPDDGHEHCTGQRS